MIPVAAALAATVLLIGGGSGAAASPKTADDLIVAARQDLARGDAVAAEIKLARSLDMGASRRSVAAYMGEAKLLQGALEQARDWLQPGEFSPASAAAGFRVLAKLERQHGNLQAAGEAFDKAIAITPDDSTMWVEIGRLRYAGGEHLLAIDAAVHALELDPTNFRALEFRGQLVRDSYGLAASLPWFEAALARAPEDLSILGEYAATLGDLGRTREMLTLTRHMLDLDPGNPRAFYLQAVMAARAGKFGLARDLFKRAGGKLNRVPGAMLLEGVLEIAAGNHTLAAEALERLVKVQPYNHEAQELLARALFLGGEFSYLVGRFSAHASKPTASPYLQTVVGRAYENLGQRDLAASLLDMASQPRDMSLRPIGGRTTVGTLIEQGRLDDAGALAEKQRAANPGSYGALALVGDAQLALQRPRQALEHYTAAARIRMTDDLMLRRYHALVMVGDMHEAANLVHGYLLNNPMSKPALRLAASLAASSGDWPRARRLLEFLRANGGERDVQLLADLALTQIRTGDAMAAESTGRAAYRLQPANPVGAQAWGLSLAALQEQRRTALALLAKARAMLGDNPLLAEGRLQLARNQDG